MKNKESLYWAGLVVGLIALIVTWTLFPEMPWISALVGVAVVADLVILIRKHIKAFKTRSATFGLQSVVTAILVICLVGVVNFLAQKNTFKWDLTANKIHTLSDQTLKQLKALKSPVKATLFAKVGSREKFRTILENYSAVSSQFKVEYVDPDKEPARVKQAGVKKYDTLVIEFNGRTGKVEEVNEEKLTNELIKLSKEKRSQLCALSGHGEKDLRSKEAEGYALVKEGLEEQAYEVRDLQLLQEGKIPPTCDAILIAGTGKAFFDKELKIIDEFLAQGGRALVALDTELKGAASRGGSELWPILAKWHIKVQPAMIVDPLSKLLGADAATAVVTEFNKDHAIGRDFRGQALFPFARPLDVIAGAKASLKVNWIAKTTPTAWGETDLAGIGKGPVAFNAGKDLKGPVSVAVAAEGKLDDKAPRATRLVVLGSSMVGTNSMARFGGNLDLVLNSISWVMEDETMISIRTKEEGGSKVELSQKAGTLIFWISVLIVPILIAVFGIVVWVRRRKL